jgi:hypothetical protein
MRRISLTVGAIAIGIAIGFVLAKRLAPVQAHAKTGFGFAAVPGERGGQGSSAIEWLGFLRAMGGSGGIGHCGRNLDKCTLPVHRQG